MRTFVSGLVFMLLAVGVLALSPVPALAGTSSPGREGSLPGSFTWSSSGPLVSPNPDVGHPVLSVKDPTVYRYEGRWHVCFTPADTAGRRSHDPCRLRFLSQGMDPASSGEYHRLPWRPALLTQTNSTC